MSSPEDTLPGPPTAIRSARGPGEPSARRQYRVTPGTCVIPYGTVSSLDIRMPGIMDKIVIDDFGDNGLPSTIEGSIRSGDRAAELVLGGAAS